MATRLDGNVYVNPAYTSQEAIDALGGTSSITGETLTYGVNAFAEGGTTTCIPAEGGTIFYQDVNRLGSSIYNDGTYDAVFLNTQSNYLYAVPKMANQTYTRDIKIYVDGGTHQHITLLGRSNNVQLLGDLSFTAKNADLGQDNQNMGGGDSTDASGCVILGNVTFDISNCQSGGSFYVHYGSVGSVDQHVKITGRVDNFTLNRTDDNSPTFRGVRTGDGQGVYADFDLTVSNSSFKGSLEFGYPTNNSTWDGAFTMTVSATTAANIYAYERADALGGDHTFSLTIADAQTATRTGTIGNFDVITVTAGANLIATTINDADELNIALGAKITTQNLQGIDTINVIGDLVENDTVIISGLTITDLDAELYINDVLYEAGKFPGFYEITGGNLIVHNASSTVLLVNSNYEDGEKTELGPKGYSTIAKAQAAVTDKATTTIMVTTMDDDVDENVFTADVVTKDYTTSIIGDDGETVSLDGYDIVIGDENETVDSANVTISYTDNINAIRFGNIGNDAKVAIDHAGDDEDTAIGTFDMTGASINGTADITVESSVIKDLKLADQLNVFGSFVIKDSTIENVYAAGYSHLNNDLTGGNTITNVYAEGLGDTIKLAGSEVETYMAGLSEGGSLDALTYNDAVSAKNLIIGGNSNTIGTVSATFNGGEVENLVIGGEGDTITNQVNLTFNGGKFDTVVIGEDVDSIDGEIFVHLAGGTNAAMQNGQVLSGADDVGDSFPGIVYGASVTDILDGGTEGTCRILYVYGNAKINSIVNFTELNVYGGTLNVAGGDGHDSEVSEYNTLKIDGNITNMRAISAGSISATNFWNYGLVGTKRDADSYDSTGIELIGDLYNTGYVKTSGISVGGSLTNSGKISATGAISVQGYFENSGEIFIRSAFSRSGEFTQEGGIDLDNVDVTNTGFISVGYLTGVKDLTTSKLYVTGGAEISGNITIDAGAEVAFTNKANDQIENGLTLGGSITMSDTSSLIVSGDLNTSGAKTITVNVGDLTGSNEIVHAEGGVNSWTIKLVGDKAGLYDYVKTETSVTIYSLDELYVNSNFSADGKIVVDGKTLVYGKNAFSSVADAVAAAKSGATIVITGDKTGMDVNAAGFNVEIEDSTVGVVTAKTIYVDDDSTIDTIASATKLTIDADAVLTLTGTMPATTSIVIDAEEGFGSRLVLDVDTTKVTIDPTKVSVISPFGKNYSALVLPVDPESPAAHAGDLYLISTDYVYFRKDQSAFVDGDTFDSATGDALFAGVNVFATREEAIAAAQGSNGVLVLVGWTTNEQKGSAEVTTMFESQGGSSGLYGTDGNDYSIDADHTTIVKGASITTTVYGLNKAYNTAGKFTMLVEDSVMSGTVHLTGNTHANVMNGNVTAVISDSTLGQTYIGYGDFGTVENQPIDINVTVSGSTLGAFFGIQTEPNNTNADDKQFINANIDINIYDSVIGGTFTVLNTNNQHWNGNGATLLQTYFTSGSINVEIGGSRITDNIRTGLSLELAGKAPQAFNVPSTLHIVATENSSVTTASYLCEWDTIIVDATANLQLNTIQYTTTAISLNGQTDAVLDGRNTLTQVMINMSGYESGTHQVIKASNEIYTDANLSNITVIGDNDLTGQCQLAYTYSNAEETVLNGIYVFDKSDDMYVNAGYNATVSGTTSASGQELLFGYNAHTDFDSALFYTNDWGGTIVVTGGNFDAQDFEGNNVEFQNGVIGEITMGGNSASNLKIGDDARFEVADGSNLATLEISDAAVLGDIENFATIKFGAGAEITAASFDLTDASVVIDVDGYTGSSHVVLTADGITGFDATKVSFVGENADKYSMIQDGNTLVLKSAIQSNTYVNSAYTAEITGTILPDGTYLEYGFNAFSTLAEGAAALGGESNTMTVTGGTFEETFQLASGNLALLDGVVVDGVVAGNGKNSITIDGNVTLGGIEGVSNITITTSSLLVSDYIDLGTGGTIYVSGALGSGRAGNLFKIISTKAGISGATLSGDPGLTIYQEGNDVYLLNKTRIYMDPTFTEAVTGTTVANGDTLIWGVNAFRVASNVNLANMDNAEARALNDALVTGGTLFISNWGTAGSQAGDVRTLKDVSIVAQGPTNFSIVFGNNGGGGHVVNDDINITITNTGTPQGNTRIIHSNNDNARWTFNGNVIITFNGTGNFNTNASFGVIARSRFNGDLLQINMDGSKGLNNDADYWLFRDVAAGDYDNVKLIEVNITGVTTPNSKWAGLFAGNPNVSAKQVVLNMTDCVYRGGNWSYSLVDSGELARNTNFDVHLSGTTIEGLLSGQRKRDQNVPGTTSVYEGVRTLYVDGDKVSRVQQAQMFNHFVIDARAQLIVNNNNNPRLGAIQFMAHNSSGQDSITIDVTNYTGADKMVLQAPSFSYGQQGASLSDIELKLVGDTEGKYAMGLGLTHGAFIITKNGDVIYNAGFSTDDNGRAFGNSFILYDDADANAFSDFDDAKDAFDAHESVNPGRTLFVSGHDEDAFYADGYAVTINGGTYEEVYGNDDEENSVASVNLKITDGQFFEVAASDGNGNVTGDARIELAGGKFGIPATYTTPDDPEEEPEIDEPEVPATISGSKDNVGGASTLVVSADLSIVGKIEEFDAAIVNANLTVTGDFKADAITIDASKILTVEGAIEADTITIDATAYQGPTKVIAVSESFEDEQPAVTINGDLDVYDYRYVDDTLYLVSKNAGNVYLNSTWDESISGTIYNGELLVWGVNAFGTMEDSLAQLTSDYTLYVTGGVFDGTYTFADNSKIDIRDGATAITGLVLGNGTNLTISGVTSGAVSIGSIAAVEGQTSGYNVVASSETAFGTIDGIRSFTFTAGQDVSVDAINYRPNGGYLNVDFAGYTNGAGVGLQTQDGINNFLQYNVVLPDGSTVSRNTVGASNNDGMLMPYYDPEKKAVMIAERGEFAFLEAEGNSNENGTVVSIEGKTATKVYGYNVSEWNVNVGRYAITGGTLFADGGEKGAFYWFFTAAPINVNVTGITTGGFVAGYNDDSAANEKYREGDFTAVIDASTITWFACIAGQGNATTHQEMVVAKYNEEEEEYEDVAWNITITNGTHDTNDFRVARYANLSGGTVNVTIADYSLRGDLHLFNRIFNGKAEGHEGDELDEVNVYLTNVQSPASKWLRIWGHQEDNSTKINITITDSNFVGDNYTIGIFDDDLGGSWNGEADVYISGMTMTQGRLGGDRGSAGGGLNNIAGTRRLHVVGGTNNIALIRQFNTIEIEDGLLLTGQTISMAEGGNFILRGEEGYTGEVKEYAVVGTTILGAAVDAAEFVDEDGYEIDGYKAAVGGKSVFIYKTDGDVYFSSDYTADITGATVTDADGKLNYLVFGDNAVATYAAAIDSADARTNATIQVENTIARDFYTKGYRVSLNGGRFTTVYGGNAPTTEGELIVPADSVSSADITINSGATVSNVSMATPSSEVSGDALLTVGAGVVFATGSTTGVIDGGAEFVGGDSDLVFLGDATARTITGFDNVTLSADGLVELLGNFDGAAITIDATDFVGSTKKVLVAEGGFGDVSAITVTVKGDSSLSYQFLDDGKTLVLTSLVVSDTFANTSWTEADVHNTFVGDTALIWGKNAFASFAEAAAAVGQDATLTLDGGASTDAITLTKNNDVFVGASTAATSVGSIAADGGALTVANNFSANELSGFSALNLNAGNTLTVSGGIELANDATITIDVTGYAQNDADVVVISTENGITGVPEAITVTGENDKIFYAYYNEEDKDVHLMRVDNFYVDVAYGTAGENIQPGQTNPITGEPLIWGVNAFYYLNNGLNAMKPGQCLYINGRIGNNINTGDRMGNIYITGSTVPVLINGYTSGDQVYTGGDVWLTVENSTIATAAGSFLFGTVTANEAWNHNQHILGNMTVNVIGSTVGGDTGAILVTGINFVNVLGTTEEAATITFNFVDSIIRDDLLFIGDSPLGKDETFQGVTRKGANLVINLENVIVPQDKWWRIQDGDQGSQGTVTVNIKDSTIGGGDGSMRFALDNNWGTGWNATPHSSSDWIFNLDNSNVVGYLVAGRLNYDELGDTFTGAKTLNLVGDNSIRYSYWFKEVNLAAGATLTGRVLRLASAGGVINVDVTGYTGKSKVIVGMDNAFENVTSINVTGTEGTDYEVLTSDRAIVIKGALKDMYVNSTYTAETCPAGTVYNGELLFFGENAFATIDEAAQLLTDDAVLYITGGTNLLGLTSWAHSISIDATAEVTYSGSDVIAITGDLANAGLFTISAAGFVGGASDVTVLTATSITGDGTFATDDDTYMIRVINGNEVHLIQKKTDMFVDTAWEGLVDGTPVTAGDVTAVIGIDAFATADAAAASVAANGSITILGGSVSFSSAILIPVVAKESATVENTAVGTGTVAGILTLESGAAGKNLSVRGKGTLLVESGAKVSGLGMLKGAVVNFASGSVLDFDISGTTAGASPSVTNFSVLAGTPDYTITLAADQAEGEYLLADDAANFNSTITLFVDYTSVGVVSLDAALVTTKYIYTLGITDNSELALTITENVLPDVPTLAYVNSEWAGLEEGTQVTVGSNTATIGYDAFADLGSGIAGVTDDGSVQIVGGEVSFANGYYKTITVGADATVVGTASFLNRPITIDGTMAFDAALTTRTTAQFADVQFISGDTKYTLTVENPAEGTYMLASGLWYDELYQPVFNGSVVFGNAVLTVGNDVQVGDYIYGLRTTSNLELLLTIDKAVAPTTDVEYLTASLDGYQNMIGRIVGSETAGFTSDVKFYTLDSAPWGMVLGIEDGWTYAGVGDFNGDGMDDILRYNSGNGLVVTDNSNGNGTFTPAVVNFKNASWDILGTGDFNGDGFDDVLVANRTAASATIGLLGYWSKGTEWTLINGYSDEWTLVDTGDYDGNGSCDMLWKNSFVGEGGLTYNAYCTWRLGDIEGVDWSIVMVAKVNETETPDTDAWSYLCTGDFNGDSIDDIAMVNDVGMVAINTMAANGTSYSWTTLDMIAEDWSVVGVADLNLDGIDDIILGNEVEGVGTLAGYWQISPDEQTGYPTNTWKDVGWLV